MSRKASRASNAARKKAIAVRRERAQRAAGSVPSGTAEANATAGKRRENRRAARTTPMPPAPSASDARLWTALLVGGAAVAIGLLGRQIVDMLQDRARPALFQNDVYSALGSIALLAIVGLFAYNRRRLGR